MNIQSCRIIDINLLSSTDCNAIKSLLADKNIILIEGDYLDSGGNIKSSVGLKDITTNKLICDWQDDIDTLDFVLSKRSPIFSPVLSA